MDQWEDAGFDVPRVKFREILTYHFCLWVSQIHKAMETQRADGGPIPQNMMTRHTCPEFLPWENTIYQACKDITAVVGKYYTVSCGHVGKCR